MKDYKIFAVADSVTDTLQFDVIETATGSQVKSGDVPVTPTIDMFQMPSGLGFKQQLDIVEGDTIDYVVTQTIKKKNIKLNLLWSGMDAYQKYQAFTSWLARYIDTTKYHIRLSYQIGTIRRYVEISPIDIELGGRQGRIVTATITLQPLTPFYEENEISFQIVREGNTGKIYNYEYPYVYGGGAYSSSNVISNGYLKKLPLKIILVGPMLTPSVSISKVKENGDVESTPYLQVSFMEGFQIDNNEEVVIDAFNNKVYLNTYTVTAGGVKELVSSVDVFNSVDKTKDSFLFAEPGDSKINVSLDEGSSCIVSYVGYLL